ncbi:MAG TPA: aldo/keto reductase [Candidatus Bathyarchaeia archaeon]|nr:aldo/keto reductase [Candidatus Bathyarchaeia archaeon]
MKTIRLGKTNLVVSRIGIGGIPIQRPNDEDAIKVIQRALDLGITFIDTAYGYTVSEERVGKAIAGRRDKVVIATKGGWRSKEIVLEHINTSLKRMNIDYIDIWQFHNVSTEEAFEGLFKEGGAMEGAKIALEEGKIKHLGLSSHSVEIAIKAAKSGFFEVIQFPLNFISDHALDELIPLVKKNDIGFIAMKPFAGGNIRKANLAIKYLLQFDNVIPDPGVEKIEEVEELVEIVNGSWVISQGERTEMEQISSELGTKFCRQCGYCQPCPENIQISMIMITKIMWKLWPKDFLQGGWFAKAMETGKNCKKCGDCESRCPYNLEIRDMIEDNIQFYEENIAKTKS